MCVVYVCRAVELEEEEPYFEDNSPFLHVPVFYFKAIGSSFDWRLGGPKKKAPP